MMNHFIYYICLTLCIRLYIIFTLVNTTFVFLDNGHSFDNLLFYGCEVCLIIFEIFFLGLVDLGTNNYLFDMAMLYLLMEVS